MKKAFVSLAVLCLGVGLASVDAGCVAQKCDENQASAGNGDAGTEETREGTCVQFKSLTRFRGANAIVRDAEWLPGSPITIESRNGDVEVVQGSGTTVRATFRPVVVMAYDTPDSRVNEEFDKLNLEVVGDANGVLVKTSRNGTVQSTLGADITIEIPPSFDGALSVDQDNGQTLIDFAGSATAMTLNSTNGSCEVAASATATTLNLVCNNGDFGVNVPGAPAGTESRTITGGDLTDYDLSFVGVPATQPFTVQVLTGGSIEINNDVGAGCTTSVAAENSKSVFCHGATQADPIYKVNGGSLSDVTLTF